MKNRKNEYKTATVQKSLFPGLCQGSHVTPGSVLLSVLAASHLMFPPALFKRSALTFDHKPQRQ